MSVCKNMRLLIIVLLATQALSQELNSTLHSTVNGAQFAYIDEMVVFTCVVRGSNNLLWTSKEYIGADERLTLTSIESKGTEVRAIGNNQTVARLIMAVDTGDVIIVSELHIRIKATYPVASVQCVNGGANTMTSTSFLLADAALVDCDRQSGCPGEIVTCTCTTGNSNILAWMINGSEIQFMSGDPLWIRQNISESSSFATLTEDSNVNGIRVIMSNLTFSVSSDDIVLSCQNVDRTITKPFIVPTAENCPVNPSDETPTGSDNIRANDNCTGPIVAAVVVPVIIFIMLILVIALIMYKFFQASLKEKDHSIAKLNGDVAEKDQTIKSLEKELANKKEELRSLAEEIKIKDQQLGDKVRELNKLTANMGQHTKLMEEKGKQLKKLQNEIREKDEALKNLPGKMKTERNAVFRTLKGNTKKEMDQLLKEKGTSVEKDEALTTLNKVSTKLREKMDKAINDAAQELESKMKEKIEKILEKKQETLSCEQQEPLEHRSASQDEVVPQQKTSSQSGILPSFLATPINTIVSRFSANK